jgi:Flp pilus assembly protein TadG
MKPLRTFLRDRRGVTAVEFAILAPAMIMLISGSLELGHMIFARVALEGAVTEAARIATASMETNESDRNIALRTSVLRTMASFALAKDKTITIETKVYRDFSTAYPEPFTDTNGNKVYDIGEIYIDRNKNQKWDPATQIAGTLGGPGDVISLTVVYPKRILFDFLPTRWGLGEALVLRATTVVRNEAVVRRT